MIRRDFLSLSASGICGRVLPSREKESGPDIEIGVYITETARDKYGSGRANKLSKTIEDVYREAFPAADLSIGPEEVISVPDSAKDYAKESLRWWNGRGGGKDSNLLVFSLRETEWRNHDGFGYYYKPYSVVTGYSKMDISRNSQHLAVHETAHNFNLRHDDHEKTEEEVSIMYPDPWETDKRLSLDFSEKSKEQIQSKI